MPPKSKTAAKKPASDQDVDEILEISQGSDDSDVMIQLMQKMKENASKKQKESEAQFLRKAKTAFEAIPVAHGRNFAKATSEVQTLFDDTMAKRALINDKIRKTWLAILKEQARGKAILERLAQLEYETLEKLESETAEALAAQERACEEEKSAIEQINVKCIQDGH